MKFSGIVTIDEGISFANGELRELSEDVKKLFPDDDMIEVIEDGKSYILNKNYIILLTF
ncbi:hypothetical protein Javan290_0059 [Streptococcus phage Javan290]|uniref:hypothetical protein n=1 Tax=Streptococcus marmotae TaxID=1825069 RepID=UPI0010C56AB4|nr:hypothetical protein [Streptococcus marmotae]QBX26113.1 hypothetical protein Javan290_0059 [Streptococcus phage Javan290]